MVPPALCVEPVVTYEGGVESAWVDGDGVFRPVMAVFPFQDVAQRWFEYLGVGTAYSAVADCAIFALEAHMTFAPQCLLRVGDGLRVVSQLLGYRHNRLHFFHVMTGQRAGFDAEAVASFEAVSVHVDRTQRRTTPFPPDRLAHIEAVWAAHKDLAVSPRAGVCIDALDAGRD